MRNALKVGVVSALVLALGCSGAEEPNTVRIDSDSSLKTGAVTFGRDKLVAPTTTQGNFNLDAGSTTPPGPAPAECLALDATESAQLQAFAVKRGVSTAEALRQILARTVSDSESSERESE